MRAISGQQTCAQIAVMAAAIGGKAPCAVGNCEIISTNVGAGEIEVDQAGDFAAQHQHIVGKQVGMDGRNGQISGPVLLEMITFQGNTRAARAGLNAFKPRFGATLRQRPPCRYAKAVGPRSSEICQRRVHLSERGAG